MPIPVIDLFSGPGGLGEGFAGLGDGSVFKLIVSAEMDSAAYRTLRLRSYFRLLKASTIGTGAYYDFCNGKSETEWNSEESRRFWEQAGEEALNITLGTAEGDRILDEAIDARLSPTNPNCVLIGGPPCQAYSLAGRSRNLGKENYRPEDDHRHFLYREYLRVLQKCRPAVFVMENVKGILSSRVGGRQVFNDILADLADPFAALNVDDGNSLRYRICSLTSAKVYRGESDTGYIDPFDFVVRSEEYGIPQARHRVILLGIRNDIADPEEFLTKVEKGPTVYDAIKDLPRLRSRLSRQQDSGPDWAETVIAHCHSLAHDARLKRMEWLSECLTKIASQIPKDWSAGELRMTKRIDRRLKQNDLLATLWDENLDVVLNHESRGHMTTDLRRYLFASTFAQATGRSPKGHFHFNPPPPGPNHANWTTGHFSDRFRVQLYGEPATTVTSHISKDGHYFIHPDPTQCRSLTVREAARLQTFPDNYFFQGNRTQQLHQVGNAVPPILAGKIARIVAALLHADSLASD